RSDAPQDEWSVTRAPRSQSPPPCAAKPPRFFCFSRRGDHRNLHSFPTRRSSDLDWHRLGNEAAEVLADVIRIDTQNPPGGETAAANALARKLEGEGIEAQVFESSPGRGNLHARLPGNGGAPPIILLAHLDVVPADPRGWRVPPFSGALEHGYVYGRGALDAKGVAVVELMALVALKRSGEPIDRDVILLATADEETGGKAGAG